MKPIVVLFIATVVACGGQQKPEQPQPSTATVEQDPLVVACDAGTANSCLVAADAAEKRGKPAEGARLYLKACELGAVDGCALAGGAFGDAQMPAESLAAFEQGCAKQDATACYGAGLAHLGTFGGTEDAAAARVALKNSCDLGLPSACGELAGLLASGTGGDADPAQAEQIWAQACDAGDGTSCTRLGLNAWSTDTPQAGLPYFEKACVAEVNDHEGCAYLGWLLWSDPDGTEHARGVATLNAACTADSAMGCALRANVHAKNGELEDGKAKLQRACELAPSMCEKMSASFEEAQSP